MKWDAEKGEKGAKEEKERFKGIEYYFQRESFSERG